MGSSVLLNQISVSENSGAEKMQSDYHCAVTLREIALLDINAH